MKVRIYKPHTHAGRRYNPGPDGVEIEVSKSAAAWLERAGVTAPAVAAEASAKPPATATGKPDTPPAADPMGFGSGTTTRSAPAGKQ